MKHSIQLRIRLLEQITEEIDRRGWTPKECEVHLSMRQARVSELLNRKSEAFSLDKLSDIASVMGCAITISLGAPE